MTLNDWAFRLTDAIHGVAPTSKALLALLVALVVLALLGFWASEMRRARRARYRRGRFLSANEKAFLRALDRALGEGYRVFAQVRLAELADVEANTRDELGRAALSKVFGKSVDFVICEAASCEPVVAIELDDRSHLLPQRRERDAFVNEVFNEIGLPLLRIVASRDYCVPVLRETLAAAGFGVAQTGIVSKGAVR